MAVDLVESVLQSFARLAIDAPDRVFERGERLVQVERLGVEIIFALLRRVEFLERRQIHRAQLADLAIQARDVRLPRTRAFAFFQLDLELLLVRASVGELLCELPFGQARFLFLQPDLPRAAADRAPLLLYRSRLL